MNSGGDEADTEPQPAPNLSGLVKNLFTEGRTDPESCLVFEAVQLLGKGVEFSLTIGSGENP